MPAVAAAAADKATRRRTWREARRDMGRRLNAEADAAAGRTCAHCSKPLRHRSRRYSQSTPPPPPAQPHRAYCSERCERRAWLGGGLEAIAPGQHRALSRRGGGV